MEKFDLKNITLLEQVESKEAEQIYLQMETKYERLKALFMFIPAILILTSIFLIHTATNQPTNQDNNTILLPIGLILIIFSIILMSCLNKYFNNKIKPYKKMYELALKNDETRHQARLFYKEFKYLENKEQKPITREKIIESNETFEESKNKIKSAEEKLEERINKIKQMNLRNKKEN